MFSMIRIDRQSLNLKFQGFMLILSVPWGQQRIKCPDHTFFICFCDNTDVALDGHYGSDGFIPTAWTLSLCEVVELKLMRCIPEHWMKPYWPIVAIQTSEADKKSARPMEKSCVTRTFCFQLASWDAQCWYETLDLVIQTLLINSNYWNHFNKRIMQLFLGRCDEKLTVAHADQWKNGQDFVLH